MKRVPIYTVRIQRWRDGVKQLVNDKLSVEEPLEIRINNQPISVTMRTPGHDEELVAGFLFSEGIVKGRKAIASIDLHPRNKDGNIVNITLGDNETVDFERLKRSFISTSSCGLCGRESIIAVKNNVSRVRSEFSLSRKVIESLPKKLLKVQTAFASTGGLHAAALIDTRGRVIVAREDIGRHNAVDKVIGWGLLRGKLPFDQRAMLVSGRASFEIVQKTLMANLPMLCAVSAPSNLAVELSKSCGQTLIGFIRENKMNVYSGAKRVLVPVG